MLRSYCYSHDKTFVQILSTELLSSWQRWSLGVLGFELLTGSTPFAVASGSSGNGREKRTGTELRILKEDPAIPKGMSPEVESLLRELLLKDPTQRLGSKGGTSYVSIRSCQRLSHPTRFYQKLLRLYTFNVHRHSGASQIKNHPAFEGFNWEACNARQLRPPIQPQLASELDLSLFSDEFTQLPIAESPAIVPQNEGLFKV